jgi:hypothetical protein
VFVKTFGVAAVGTTRSRSIGGEIGAVVARCIAALLMLMIGVLSVGVRSLETYALLACIVGGWAVAVHRHWMVDSIDSSPLSPAGTCPVAWYTFS